jgi:hypothetical protein
MLRLKARSITMHPGKAEKGPSCLKTFSRYRGGGQGNAFDQSSAVAELDGHAEGLPDVVLAARGEA